MTIKSFMQAMLSAAVALACLAAFAKDPVVTYRAAPEGFPGAVLVTADADGAPHFDCVGEAAPGRRMEPDTVFWMASNTKGVLAALVLNLVSEGKLSLDDPVEKYFPSWKKLPVKNRPTLRMLLCHTSGLDVFPKKAIARPGMEALAEHVHVEPLKFEPDTKYLYSNWDIDVAAAIVEKVTGRPFDVEMAERIFKPLGMADSTFIPNASQNARRAAFYKLSDKKPPMPTKIVRNKLAPPYMEVGVHPEAGGGLLSTPQDMIKFFQMIARGGLTPDGRRLISAPLMEKWTAKQTPKCVKVGYSFGMKVDGKGSLSHGGAAGTWAEANVKTRKARLYMVNVQGSSKVAKSFRDDWMKKTELVPARAVVTEAGADPTGKTDSTAAIQKCIDRVSAAGGATVVVPPGVYRILYLSLRPHVRLELAGGVERATDGWTPEVAARAMNPSRGGAALKPGEKGVVFRGNKIVLSERSPLRKMWVSTPRQREVSVADATPDRPQTESRRGLTSP